MVITVWVHRVDTDRFPAVPAGWRWCVGMGDDPSDPRFWMNAGWAPTRVEAEVEGEQNAATATNALVLAGVDATRTTRALEADPCPAVSLDHPMNGSLRLPQRPS